MPKIFSLKLLWILLSVLIFNFVNPVSSVSADIDFCPADFNGPITHGASSPSECEPPNVCYTNTPSVGAINCHKLELGCNLTVDASTLTPCLAKATNIPAFNCGPGLGFGCGRKEEELCQEGGSVKCESNPSSAPSCDLKCSDGKPPVYGSVGFYGTGDVKCEDSSKPSFTCSDSDFTPVTVGGKCTCQLKGLVSATGSTGINCSTEPNKCSSSAGMLCNPNTNKPVSKDDPNAKGVYTAIGCIPTDPSMFVKKLLELAVYAAGGIALLLMIFGAFRMVTSAGNQESLKAGSEQFTSAIIGLLFIIFAITLMEIIGVDILGILVR